jgi:hypothetical protein
MSALRSRHTPLAFEVASADLSTVGAAPRCDGSDSGDDGGDDGSSERSPARELRRIVRSDS